MLLNLAAGDVFAIFIWTYFVIQNMLFIEVDVWFTIEQIPFDILISTDEINFTSKHNFKRLYPVMLLT